MGQIKDFLPLQSRKISSFCIYYPVKNQEKIQYQSEEEIDWAIYLENWQMILKKFELIVALNQDVFI